MGDDAWLTADSNQVTRFGASNWRYVGATQARGAMGGVPAKTPKMVFLYPLQRDWRAVLLGMRSAPAPRGLNRPGPDTLRVCRAASAAVPGTPH